MAVPVLIPIKHAIRPVSLKLLRTRLAFELRNHDLDSKLNRAHSTLNSDEIEAVKSHIDPLRDSESNSNRKVEPCLLWQSERHRKIHTHDEDTVSDY